MLYYALCTVMVVMFGNTIRRVILRFTTRHQVPPLWSSPYHAGILLTEYFLYYPSQLCFSLQNDKTGLPHPGGHLNIKMSSYQYTDPHVKDKTVSRPSYLYHGNHHTWERRSLYWDGAQISQSLEALILSCLVALKFDSAVESLLSKRACQIKKKITSYQSRDFRDFASSYTMECCYNAVYLLDPTVSVHTQKESKHCVI